MNPRAFRSILNLGLAACCMPPVLAAGPSGLLNDTGQTSCYRANHSATACSSSGVGSDAGVNPRQDARFGRDVAGMPKVGGGAGGFDFTRICMSGQAAGTGSCPASPAVGTNPNEWACTKDNVTNLIWSIETISNINWTNAMVTHPGNYNAANRCGFGTDWRVPTRRELLSIVHHGVSVPAIDSAYFPGTWSIYYWTSDVFAANSNNAWVIHFYDAYVNISLKTANAETRLVRSGP